MAESRARTLANLANTNALSVDNSSLDVGISSASPDSDLNVVASIKMDGPSGIISATSFSGDGSALTGIANTAVIAATQLTVTGVVTAASFTGDGANLTNVGVDTATVDTGSLKVSGISTFSDTINAQAISEINSASDLKQLDKIRVNYLGKKGRITEQLKMLGTLPPDERPKAGQIINNIKIEIQNALEIRKNNLFYLGRIWVF